MLIFFFVFAATGNPTMGSIHGRVVSIEGQIQGSVIVKLTDLRRQTKTDQNGQFSFDEVPFGQYKLVTESTRYGSSDRGIVVDQVSVNIDIVLDFSIHQEQTVSGHSSRMNAHDSSQTISVLSGHDLDIQRQASLGATLNMEAGISASSYGVAASRPIIRGLTGNRVRVLEGGIESGVVSAVSADHAITLDTQAADRIEVLRGPATLRFGANGMGGVINVLDDRIPEFLPDQIITGRANIGLDSVANEQIVSMDIDGAIRQMAWHLDLVDRQSDDYELSDRDEFGHDELANSSTNKFKGTVGASWISESAYIGLALTQLDYQYGLPGSGGDSAQDFVRIDQSQERIDLRGALERTGIIEQVTFQSAFTDYEHIEIESDVAGTLFKNQFFEGRLESHHQVLAGFRGSIGGHLRTRNFEAIGDEAFVPANETLNWGVFAVEDLEREAWALQLGARFESQRIDTDLNESVTYSGLSWAAGMVMNRDSSLLYTLNVAKSVRAPAPEELYAFGAHLATDSFEVGNPELDMESALGLEFGLRKHIGSWKGEFTVFRNEIGDFIYERRSGRHIEGLPEYVYDQADAVFWGGEVHLDFNLLHRDPHHIEFELFSDLVRAQLELDSEPLPRIPPWRLGSRIRYEGQQTWSVLEILHVSAQHNLAPFETHTPEFVTIDWSAGFQFFWAATVHEVSLHAQNLSNEQVVIHTSFIKDRAPLPGRNIRLTYDFRF